MGDLKSIKAPRLSPSIGWPRGLQSVTASFLSTAEGVMAVIFLGVKNMIINNASLSPVSFCVCTVRQLRWPPSLPPFDPLPHPIDDGRWLASPLINSSIAIGINRLSIYLSPIYVIVVGTEGEEGERGKRQWTIAICGHWAAVVRALAD